jgi:DNA-binding response OmpR family regulator
MRRRCVLIVDGTPETRASLAVAFTRKQWSILSASSLAQGLAMLASGPDRVILDLVLPDGQGEDLLRNVREGHNRAPVIAVLTVEADANRLGEVAKRHPDVQLLKPMDPDIVARLCGSELEVHEDDSEHEQH